MRTRPVGLGVVAALAGFVLLLAAGPAGYLGSAGASTKADKPKRCSAYDGTHAAAPSSTPEGGMAERPGMAEMPGMDGADGAHGAAGTEGTAGIHGPGRHSEHSTQDLRDRLADTPPGGTLTVQPGVYSGPLVIDRPVTLVGIGHPVLRGDGKGTVLTIRAAGTVVRGLVVEGSGPGPVGDPAGIKVEANGVIVKNVHVRDTFTGIRVNGARDAQIIGNVIEGRKTHTRGDTTQTSDTQTSDTQTSDTQTSDTQTSDTQTPDDGDMAGMAMSGGQHNAQGGRGDAVILFNAIRPVVAGNRIADARDGIYLSFGQGSRIECNSVVGSRYALHSMYGRSVTVAGNSFAANLSGPVMMYGGPVTLEDNVIRDHHSASTGFGVLLLDVGGVRLLRNVIVSNRVGIQVEGENDTAVELNTIALNQVGVSLYPSAHSVLSQNSLIENTVQVLGMGPDGGGGDSEWSRDGVGNFWSNYRGYDRSGSGIGEIPHVEGAAAGRLLAANPVLLALASSPAFTLMRAVEQRSAGQRPVSVDNAPLVDPRSPPLPNLTSALPSTNASADTVHASRGTGLVGAITLAVCALALLRLTRRRRVSLQRTQPRGTQPERTKP